jgi:hypothetical protein
MMNLITAKKYLPIALALAAFGTAGTAPAFAQSATKYGSVIPYHYLANGTQAPGWYAEAPSVREIAHAASTNERGKNAYAQVPATILNFAAPSGVNYYLGQRPARSNFNWCHADNGPVTFLRSERTLPHD